MQINKTYPHWHRDIPIWEVKRMYRRYQVISREQSSKVEIIRCFIPKTEEKLRPLGVPKAE